MSLRDKLRNYLSIKLQRVIPTEISEVKDTLSRYHFSHISTTLNPDPEGVDRYVFQRMIEGHTYTVFVDVPFEHPAQWHLYRQLPNERNGQYGERLIGGTGADDLRGVFDLTFAYL